MNSIKKQKLSRREALKTLAALTGASTLAHLPGHWEIPKIEVGSLPAHAQSSPGPITLSNLSVDAFGTANNCISADSSQIGTLYDTSFNYEALDGGIIAGSGVVIRQTSRFSDNSETREITTGYAVQGNEFAGTIFYSTCVHFGSSSDMRVEISLTTPDGRSSNSLSLTVSALPGAQEENQDEGSNTPEYEPL